MMGVMNTLLPSHIFYAENILILCKGSKSNIQTLTSQFSLYARASSQIFNTLKSLLFTRSMSNLRIRNLF